MSLFARARIAKRKREASRKEKVKQLDYENMSIQIDAKNKTLIIPQEGVSAQDMSNFLETNPKYREWKIKGEEE